MIDIYTIMEIIQTRRKYNSIKCETIKYSMQTRHYENNTHTHCFYITCSNAKYIYILHVIAFTNCGIFLFYFLISYKVMYL